MSDNTSKCSDLITKITGFEIAMLALILMQTECVKTTLNECCSSAAV